MKRVLIITYYWPPSGGSGVQRWVKFARYLPELGWQPVVYTPENPELTSTDTSLEAEIPSEVEVIKTHIFEPYSLMRCLTGKKEKSARSNDPNAVVTPINAQKKSFVQNLMLWIRGNCFIPDPRCMWILPSIKYLKKYLREYPVDLIVSSGPPHSMHLIARKVSLDMGIPWIVDFRDPWTKMFYFKHLKLTAFTRRMHEKLEKKVLDDANLIVSVSPMVQEDFRKMTSTPVELVTNGYDQQDVDDAIEQLDVSEKNYGEENTELFNIVHTGVFASDGNPDKLWKVLGEIAEENPEFRTRTRIRLVGKTDIQILDSIERAGLEGMTENLGYVSHETAVMEQCAAGVLILPLRKEPECRATLPGKLFEYLASRRPVIGFGDPDGAMGRIITGAKAGKTFDWDDESNLKAEILRLWDLFRQGRLSDSEEDIEAFSRIRLTRRMAELFDKVLLEKATEYGNN
ncbi:MAG: glycosyltransferase family 4 protein [Rikenellaceae bacterium]|nr:glycosyltransferase family 4 protein [Rikenellaceae bacterium]